jgi:hypothetical protein
MSGASSVTDEHDGERRKQPVPSRWARLDAQSRAAIVAAVAAVVVGLLGLIGTIIAAHPWPHPTPDPSPCPAPAPGVGHFTVLCGAAATAVQFGECDRTVTENYRGYTLIIEVCTPVAAVGGHDLWIRVTPVGSSPFTDCRLYVAYKPLSDQDAEQREPGVDCAGLVGPPPAPMLFGLGRVFPTDHVLIWGHLELVRGTSKSNPGFHRQT